MARGIVSTIRPGVLCVLAAVTAAGVPAPAQDLTFTDITKEAGAGGPAAPGKTGGHGAMFADVDGDGLPDLYFTMIFEGPMADLFFHNLGGGRFVEEGARRGVADYDGGSPGAVFADLDNDGDFDLVFAGDSKVYRNDGAGNFLPYSHVPVEGINDPRSIAFADIDADGDPDFAVACKRSGNRLVRNDWNSGNWVEVKLVSPRGQAGAFGAKVRVFTTGEEPRLIGWREARSANGYLGQDDPVLHFGLGEHFMVRIEVEFVTGESVAVDKVFAKQTVTIDGSSGEASGAVFEGEEPESPEPK